MAGKVSVVFGRAAGPTGQTPGHDQLPTTDSARHRVSTDRKYWYECIEKRDGSDDGAEVFETPGTLGRTPAGAGLAHAGGSTGRDLAGGGTASARGSGAGSQGVVRAFADDLSGAAAGDAVADVSTAGATVEVGAWAGAGSDL